MNSEKSFQRPCEGCGRMIVWGQKGEDGRRSKPEAWLRLCYDCATAERKKTRRAIK
jgi:hypothetical protein